MNTRILCAALLCAAMPAEAGVTQINVESRKDIGNGHELLEGRFRGALDPRDTHNRIITDITLAPRNAAGKVEYSATFAITRPIDKAKASGVLVYEVPNRGRATVAALEDGHIDVASGWQGDVEPGDGKQVIDLPGIKATGMVTVQFIDMAKGAATLPVKGGPIGGIRGRNFVPVTRTGAKLYRATADDAPAIEVPAADWALADCDAAPFPGKPDLTKLCVKGGFDPKYSYTLSFRAGNPKVMGIGFAATRDLVAFLRHADKDAAGNANPLAGMVRWAVGRGSSQSGNFFRGFIRLGFNSAEDGGTVFDGLNPLISARQNPTNVRFAVPGGLAYLYEAGSDGAITWGDYADPVRGTPTVSLLDRCNAARNCPKIVEIFGAAEYWNLRASPTQIGFDARADIAPPANVRRYYNASVTHGGGTGGFSRITRPLDGCVLAYNPNPTAGVNRALFKALIDCVTRGAEPPPSKYPTLAAGDLVESNAAAMGFPKIPGMPSPDGKQNPLVQYDFGPKYNAPDTSGQITMQPPKVVRVLPQRVPRTDADGNELAGIRSPLLEAPLGSYLGWNVTAAGFEAGRFCGNNGGYIPFAATRAERLAAGDPRPSVEERYPTHDAYVVKVKEAADRLVAQRYLLADDAEKLVSQARESKVP